MPVLRNSKLLSSDDVGNFLSSYTNSNTDMKRKAELLEEMKAKLKLRKLNWNKRTILLKSGAKENINSFCEPQVSITYTCQTRLVNLEIPDISLSWAGAHVLRTSGDWGEIDLMGGASFRSLYDWGKTRSQGSTYPAFFCLSAFSDKRAFSC